MELKKSLLILLLVFFAAVVLYYGEGSRETSKPYTRPTERMVVGAGFDIFSSPILIAEHRGYFKEQGLDVEIRIDGSGVARMKKMLEQGDLDLVAASQSPVVLHSFERNDYAVIAGMVYSYSELAVLGRKDRGIRNPRDLKGKTIGITNGSSGHFFLDLFLKINGLKIAEVKTVDGQPLELAEALIQGDVDAISSWQPFILNSKKTLGENAALFPPDYIFRNEFYLISRKDFIQKHPRALEKFLEAIEKAEQFIQANKDETLDIISERTNTDRDVVAAVWDGYVFELFLDQSILVTLEEIARWAIKNTIVKATAGPNYLEFIYPNALEKVKPEAVRIIYQEQGS